MTLAQLRYFCGICHYGTVTKAAQKLHISQPSLSNAIIDLEDYLGIKLFVREKNKLVLTQAGEIFLLGAKEILQKAEDLEEKISCFRPEPLPMKIGIPPMVGSLLFADFFARFSLEHPKASSDLLEQGSKNLVNMILEHEIDVAIVIKEAITSKNVETITLMESDIELCVADNHPLAKKKEVSFSEIGNLPLVLLGQESYQNNKIKERFKEKGIEPNIILTTNQISTMKNLALQNSAGGFLFKGISLEKDMGLTLVPIKEKIPITIWLVWAKDRALSDEYKNLIDFAKKYK